MKSDKLTDAIGMIDDRYIEEAHQKKEKKFNFSFTWETFGKLAAAACVLLLVINLFPVFFSRKGSSYDSAPSAAQGGGYYYESDYDSFVYDMEEVPVEAAASAEEAKEDLILPENEVIDPTKKLILTSNMTLETLDLEQQVNTVNELVRKYGGYLQHSSFSNRNNSYRYYEASIRIPADQYSAFLSELNGSGNATYYSEDVKDVTDAYMDVEARLNSLKAQEAKVLEFYDQAESLEDLMAVESRLSDIQYEISYYEARIRNFDLQINYSTMYLTINETKVYTPVDQSFFARLGRAFSNGFKGFINNLEDLIIDVVYNIWSILFLVLLFFIGRYLYRRFRNRKKS